MSEKRISTAQAVKWANKAHPQIIYGILSATAGATYYARVPSRCRILKAAVRYGGTVADAITVSISKGTIDNYKDLPKQGVVISSALPASAIAVVASSEILVTNATNSTPAHTLEWLKEGADFVHTADAAGEPILEEEEVLVITLAAAAGNDGIEVMIYFVPEK